MQAAANQPSHRSKIQTSTRNNCSWQTALIFSLQIFRSGVVTSAVTKKPTKLRGIEIKSPNPLFVFQTAPEEIQK
jgi:hypothetical protein